MWNEDWGSFQFWNLIVLCKYTYSIVLFAEDTIKAAWTHSVFILRGAGSSQFKIITTLFCHNSSLTVHYLSIFILIFALLVSLLRDFCLSTLAWYLEKLNWNSCYRRTDRLILHFSILWADVGPLILVINN